MKCISTVILVLIALTNIYSAVLDVSSKNYPYSTIQAAIDRAIVGDTVLVQPGTYYENITIHKNIVLASLYLITKEQSDIANTVINGNMKGSCIKILGSPNRNSVDSTTLIIGFTITNGSGGGEMYSCNGGGITCSFGSPILSDLIIKGNKSLYGGGINMCNGSNPILSNVTISENYAVQGGGIYINFNPMYGPYSKSKPTFDNSRLCNINNNYASIGNDIYLENSNELNDTIINVALDTFTVANATNFHIYPVEIFKLNFKNIKVQQSTKDLYVANYGDDNNSGTTLDTPLKSLHFALTKINPDRINPLTIYLANGEYSLEKIPLGLPDNVRLIGESKEDVVFNKSSLSNPVFEIHSNMGGILENFTIKGAGDNSAGIYITKSNLEIRNLTLDGVRIIQIDENVNDKFNATYQNVKISGNIDEPGIWIDYSNAILENVEISNNTARGGLGINHSNITVLNSTIVDNTSDYSNTHAININAESNVDIINSIFWNNTTKELGINSGGPFPEVNIRILNSIIKNGKNGIEHYYGGAAVYWDISNIELNPMFNGSSAVYYHLSAGSPAIDAGIQDTTIIMGESQDTIVIPPMEFYGSSVDIGAYEYNPEVTNSKNLVFKGDKLFKKIYPNPFGEITNIEFLAPASNLVTLRIYNAFGQEITTLVSECLKAGVQNFKWNASSNPPGIYFCLLRIGDRYSSRKIIVSR